MLIKDAQSRMELQRPDLRCRRRFPFRTLRSASLWVILTVLLSRGYTGCTPEPQPSPTVDLVLTEALMVIEVNHRLCQ